MHSKYIGVSENKAAIGLYHTLINDMAIIEKRLL